MTEQELENYWNTLLGLTGAMDKIDQERNTLLSTIKYPNSLFRFRSFSENSLEALEKNCMHFSSANFYDDPFDSYMQIDKCKIGENFKHSKNEQGFFEEIFRKRFPDVSIINIDFKSVFPDLDSFMQKVDMLKDIFQSNLYSICFCENVENEVLWLKYAENHKGFVLEYSLCDNVLNKIWNSQLHANILPIYYSGDKFDAYDYAVYNLALFAVKDDPDIYNMLNYKAIGWENTKISVIKKICHKYDMEWRIVPLYISPQRRSISWQPQSITIGLRTPEYKKQLIISAAKIAGISEFYQMIIDEHDEFVRIPLEV